MSTVTLSSFDTLQYVKRLRAADVPEKQAEAQAEALRAVLVEQAGVQSDASARMVSESDTKTEKAIMRLDSRIDILEQRLNARIDAMENRLIMKLSAIMVGLIAFAGAVQAVVSRL